MKTFTNRFVVNAPLQKVADFHSNPKVFSKLMPPPTLVRFTTFEPLEEGSKTSFKMWIGPLPINWVAVHFDVDPLNGFTDKQVEGPFSYWEHRHEFIPLSDTTTEVIDTIQAIPSRHLFWGPICWLIWFSLPLLFSYRGWVTKQEINRNNR
jgi:ligand-binding SRPBCC domain-containing protein